jgi:hypothetical protein
MTMLPRTGRNDVATKQDLAQLEARLGGRINSLEHRFDASHHRKIRKRAGDCARPSAARPGLGLDEAFARFERRVITCNVICMCVVTAAASLIARLG